MVRQIPDLSKGCRRGRPRKVGVAGEPSEIKAFRPKPVRVDHCVPIEEQTVIGLKLAFLVPNHRPAVYEMARFDEDLVLAIVMFDLRTRKCEPLGRIDAQVLGQAVIGRDQPHRSHPPHSGHGDAALPEHRQGTVVGSQNEISGPERFNGARTLGSRDHRAGRETRHWADDVPVIRKPDPIYRGVPAKVTGRKERRRLVAQQGQRISSLMLPNGSPGEVFGRQKAAAPRDVPMIGQSEHPGERLKPQPDREMADFRPVAAQEVQSHVLTAFDREHPFRFQMPRESEYRPAVLLCTEFGQIEFNDKRAAIQLFRQWRAVKPPRSAVRTPHRAPSHDAPASAKRSANASVLCPSLAPVIVPASTHLRQCKLQTGK